MAISATEAQRLFTQEQSAMFSDRVAPKKFLSSFFTEKTTWAKNISIQTQRRFELIAADVRRGSEGNRNEAKKSTQKIFTPPYYNEYFDATELDGYDQLYADPNAEISGVVFGRFLESVNDQMQELGDNIDRSYELQAAQCFDTGIVQLVNGDNIDFKRLAASKVDLGSAAYWNGTNAATVDPNTIIGTGCTFLREKGKALGGEFDVIFGKDVLDVYLNNNAVINRGKVYNWVMDSLTQARYNSSVGASQHGYISVKSYNVSIWSYPEFFETVDSSGNVTANYYVNPKSIIILPRNPEFLLNYAAVPQLLSYGVKPVSGKFVNYEYIDQRKTTHDVGTKSAGLAIPVAVDRIFTAKVLA